MDERKNFPIFDIQIDYQDIDSNSYSRSYVLDMNMYKGNFMIKERGLKDIYVQLDLMEKHIRKAVRLYGMQDKREQEKLKNKPRRIRR